MQEQVDFVIEKRMERAAEALRKNRMAATCVQSVDEAKALIRELIPAGSMVCEGHSTTLEETGIQAMLMDGTYQYISKRVPKEATEEERWIHMGKLLCSDWYCASANAITENGEIYQIDGHASRISLMAFGPKHVLIVAGYNKIVPDLDAARLRLQRVAAPANARRIGTKTPCAVTGVCANCRSPERICCDTLILGHQRIDQRIHVILVKEELGY